MSSNATPIRSWKAQRDLPSPSTVGAVTSRRRALRYLRLDGDQSEASDGAQPLVRVDGHVAWDSRCGLLAGMLSDIDGQSDPLAFPMVKFLAI